MRPYTYCTHWKYVLYCSSTPLEVVLSRRDIKIHLILFKWKLFMPLDVIIDPYSRSNQLRNRWIFGEYRLDESLYIHNSLGSYTRTGESLFFWFYYVKGRGWATVFYSISYSCWDIPLTVKSLLWPIWENCLFHACMDPACPVNHWDVSHPLVLCIWRILSCSGKLYPVYWWSYGTYFGFPFYDSHLRTLAIIVESMTVHRTSHR